jgi:hypothetical protein
MEKRSLAFRIALDLVSGKVGRKTLGKKSAFQKALWLCEKIGMKYDLERNGITGKDGDTPHGTTGNVNWDGKTLAVKGLTASDLCHEIAHYLIAPKHRRKLIEFGLGAGFNTGDHDLAKKCQKVSYSETVTEEEEASIFGILLEKHLKLRGHKTTLQDHQWHDDVSNLKYYREPEDVKMVQVFQRLIRKKLINRNGEPVCRKAS